jgi:glycosyltransferase involved in cell wall biosynthesis
MRILIVTPQPPYPPAQGAAIRNWHLLHALAMRHQVDLLCFGTGRPDPALCRVAQRVRFVPPPPPRSPLARLYTLLCSSDPDLLRRLDSAAFADALASLLREERYDALQVEGLELWLPVQRALARAPYRPAVVLDCHNVEYLLQQQAARSALHPAHPVATTRRARHPAEIARRASYTARRWPAAIYSRIQTHRLRREEQRACRAADRILCVSDDDATALAALAGVRPAVVPNCVDTEALRRGNVPEVPGRVVFTGHFSFRLNVEAAEWLCRAIWPLVVREHPAATLYLVGRDPAPAVQRLAGGSVVVTGTVPDATRYVAEAQVFVAPLLAGSGSRLKLLEALALERAAVTTPAGAQGLDVRHDEHLLLAGSAPAFAEAIVRLLRDPAQRQELGRRGRVLVQSRYDRRVVAPQLLDVYESLAVHAPAHRSR